MFKHLKKKCAQATVEYIILITFILVSYVIFEKYIVRAFGGRWKNLGESISAGRVYNPQTTIRCKYDFVFVNRWYNQDCYELNCDCESVAFTATGDTSLCQDCITACGTPYCD